MTRNIDLIGYQGFGNPEWLWVRGRVIRGRGMFTSSAHDSAWSNLKAMVARFRARGAPGVSVRISVGAQEVEATSDARGHFEARVPGPHQASGPHLAVRMTILDGIHDDVTNPILREVKVHIPTGEAEFAVASDLDDTVLYTFAFSRVRMLRQVLFHNAHTRLPFPGVPAFYRALQAGSDGARSNPIFYVSSSAWNLYDLMHEFMRLRQIPAGPILLRELPRSLRALIDKNRHEHKKHRIEELLAAYPQLRFLLIGDTGQRDAELYTRCAQEYPERIAAIYLRDVGVHPVRHAAIEAMAAPVRAAGIPVLLVKDTLAAAEHAAAAGYIRREALDDVAADRGPPKQLTPGG